MYIKRGKYEFFAKDCYVIGYIYKKKILLF